MLNWKVVSQSLASFTAISFVLCIGYGLLAPATFHAAWLLEAVLPGFKWLSVGSFVLGLIETTLYGAYAGAVYSALHNYFARRAHRDAALRSLRPGAAAVVILTVLAGSLAPAVWAQERPYEWGWGMHPMWWVGSAWGIGMMLLMLLFWGLAVTGIVLGVRLLLKPGIESRPDSALEILRQRYARGEIDREEFEARKRDLR
ncbi:MAG TPA: DUF5676 family membrane protein [Methylomirabilota bacterium]|jgi:uncharacterized membrane protein|nr:DUF5676 family membrane protein [Methylomirabilota bacterium]